MYADLGDNEIILHPAWNEVDRCRMLPGYGYIARHKKHHAPLAWATMVTLRGMFGPAFTYSDELATVIWDMRRSRIDPALAWREVIEAPEDPDDPLSKEMFPFQRADVTFMILAQSGLLGNAAGTGKTISLLSLLRRRAIDWEVDQTNSPLPALIICPYSIKDHWARRLPKWFPQATPYVIEGATITDRRKILKAASGDPSAVVVINVEAVRLFSRLAPYGSIALKRCKICDPKYGSDIPTSRCHIHPKELNDFGYRSVIIDEAHQIGEPESQRTRAVWAVAHDPSIRYRWAATGTPDNIERLWAMMHTVAPDEYPTKTKYIERFGLMAYNFVGGQNVIGFRPDTRQEALLILDPRFRRMIKEVVLPQLPSLIREVRHSIMKPPQRKIYNELDKRLHTRLEDGSIFIVINRLVSRIRLLQFASAHVEVEKPDEDDISTWIVHMREHSPKLDVMEEVLEEMGPKPFVIACVNRDLVLMAAERLMKRGIRHNVIMQGYGNSSDHVQACEDLKNGTLQAIVFTIKSGGTGLDMSGVDTMIRLQRPDSLIDNIQCEERISRIGSEIHESLRVIDIITENTVEERQVERLHQKLEAADEITRDRAQVIKHLQEIPPGSAEFGELVGRMTVLAGQYENLLSDDDYDQGEM